MRRLSWKFLSSTYWNSQGLFRPVMGLLLSSFALFSNPPPTLPSCTLIQSGNCAAVWRNFEMEGRRSRRNPPPRVHSLASCITALYPSHPIYALGRPSGSTVCPLHRHSFSPNRDDLVKVSADVSRPATLPTLLTQQMRYKGSAAGGHVAVSYISCTL